MRLLSCMACALAIVGFMWTSAQAHPDYGCDGCHVPHGAAGDNTEVPLWNPDHTTTTLTGNYTSPTINATMGAPDGASKLCLSCHDGSYDHVKTEHTFKEAGEGETTMGTLTNSHPISFVYQDAIDNGDSELKEVAQLEAGVLDGNGKVQCISCHDVHATAADFNEVDSEGNSTSKNLRWLYENKFGAGPPQFNNAAFCRECHLK